MTRKDFLKVMMAAAAASSVPKAFAKKEEIEKPLFLVPDPADRYHLVVTGWDCRPHYPVLKNPQGETKWEKKSFYEIVTDLMRGVAGVQKQSYGNFIPYKHEFFIWLPPSRAKYLQKKNLYGYSVEQFIRATWPKVDLYYGERVEPLETTGFGRSAELCMFWNYESGSMGEPPKSFGYSQYGI